MKKHPLKNAKSHFLFENRESRDNPVSHYQHTPMKSTSVHPLVVSYRLDSEAAAELSGEAKNLGISPHELARRVLLDWLSDHERHATVQALSELTAEVAKVRADLKEAMVAILCDAGRCTREDAEEWVSGRLFQ